MKERKEDSRGLNITRQRRELREDIDFNFLAFFLFLSLLSLLARGV